VAKVVPISSQRTSDPPTPHDPAMDKTITKMQPVLPNTPAPVSNPPLKQLDTKHMLIELAYKIVAFIENIANFIICCTYVNNIEYDSYIVKIFGDYKYMVLNGTVNVSLCVNPVRIPANNIPSPKAGINKVLLGLIWQFF